MQAKFKNHGDITVVSFIGKLDIEKALPLKEACIKNFKGKKVIFNLKELNFVGSSGINSFLETIKYLSDENINGFKLAGVGLEFRKLIHLTIKPDMPFFDSEDHAISTFVEPDSN